MIGLIIKKRKGNLLAVLLFAIVMAMISFGSLQVVASVYASNEESIRGYQREQDYRSAAELSAYQFVNDLQSITVTKDTALETSWLSSSVSSTYTASIKALVDSICATQTNGSHRWRITDASYALSAVTMDDPSIMKDLLTNLQAGYSSLSVSLPVYPDLDYGGELNIISDGYSRISVASFELDSDLYARAESSKEVLYVDNLFLEVYDHDYVDGAGDSQTVYTMRLVSGAGGVKIYRV